MRKILLLILLLISFQLLFVKVKPAYAVNNCASQYVYPLPVTRSTSSFEYFFIFMTDDGKDGYYSVKGDNGGWNDYISIPFKPTIYSASDTKVNPSGKYTIRGKITSSFSRQFDPYYSPHKLTLYRISDQPNYRNIDLSKPPNVNDLQLAYCDQIVYTVSMDPSPTSSQVTCSISANPTNPTNSTPITVNVNNISTLPPSDDLWTSIHGLLTAVDSVTHSKVKPDKPFTHPFTLPLQHDLGTFPNPGGIEVTFRISELVSTFGCEPRPGIKCTTETELGSCSLKLNIGTNAITGSVTTPTTTPIPSIVPTLVPGQPTYTPIPPLPSLAPICDQIDTKYTSQCKYCVEDKKGIWTAIGCLPTNLEVILKNYVFVYGTGITGGIAFLYFIYGAFLILTSGGNPEKIAEGKEIIISALSGLFLIIFSVFLLRVIGYDILKIPGFG